MLNVDTVGVNDNFFDLGGHSLLLVKVHTKLQEVLQQDFSLMRMFEYPTVNSLAKYLSSEPNLPFSDHLIENRSVKLNAGKIRIKQLYKNRQRRAVGKYI